MRPATALACALFAISPLCGCSSAFNSKWNEMASQQARLVRAVQPVASQPSTDVSDTAIIGRWQGTWKSEPTGHIGGLRCVLAQTGPDTYWVDYHATFWTIFTYGYSMPLQVSRRDGVAVLFEGEADLGFLAGGKYTYTGRVTPTEFHCTYRAGWDHGVFQLTRP